MQLGKIEIKNILTKIIATILVSAAVSWGTWLFNDIKSLMKELQFLEDSNEVVSKVHEILEKSTDRNYAWIALDDVCFGNYLSKKKGKEFQIKLDSLGHHLKILYWDNPTFKRYLEQVVFMHPSNVEKRINQSERCLESLPKQKRSKGAFMPLLAFNNFFVVQDKFNKCHSIFCIKTPALNGDNEEMQGFYTQSKDVAEMLIDFWKKIKICEKSGYTDRLLNLNTNVVARTG